jgi:hypothetical protein
LQVLKQGKVERMNERALEHIFEHLCLFLLKHVIPHEGKYHDHDSPLSKPEFRVLTEITRLNLLNRVIRGQMQTLMYIMCDDVYTLVINFMSVSTKL